MLRSGVRPSVGLCLVFILTLTGRAAHTQRDSVWGSMRRGQRAYSDGHTNVEIVLFDCLLPFKPTVTDAFTD